MRGSKFPAKKYTQEKGTAAAKRGVSLGIKTLSTAGPSTVKVLGFPAHQEPIFPFIPQDFEEYKAQGGCRCGKLQGVIAYQMSSSFG